MADRRTRAEHLRILETMAGHDALPPEWRALSCLEHGRVIERQFKQGKSLPQARRILLCSHHRGPLI
jgi:hypothetical protein